MLILNKKRLAWSSTGSFINFPTTNLSYMRHIYHIYIIYILYIAIFHRTNKYRKNMVLQLFTFSSKKSKAIFLSSKYSGAVHLSPRTEFVDEIPSHWAKTHCLDSSYFLETIGNLRQISSITILLLQKILHHPKCINYSAKKFQ